MIGTNWDITKEKESIAQLEKAKDEAEKANKASDLILK
jgi:hypothetical protein